ncbi:MAG: hypothetical protein PWQ70_3080 [Clostridiales bacterium]|jgi:MoaA/NifB/PqqE/SkfB family radical SAM enzyme|nr:hypothetical protein [Clostridiales bacterium]
MATLTESFYVRVNKDGSIIFTQDILKKFGITPDSNLRIELDQNKIQIFPNIHSLAKVYIEPTSRCNLSCQTCIRNTWKEPMGEMDLEIFDKLIEQLKDFDNLQTVMFGGFGEPTFHKDILYMIKKVKSLGVKTEIITNGTLLNETFIRGLIKNGLDTLWVSFDGTNDESFESIREGASFNNIIDNLKMLKRLNTDGKHNIEIGISFVAMKKNIKDLKDIRKLALAVGAKRVYISNVLPYDRKMQDQILYENLLIEKSPYFSTDEIFISLPGMDLNETTGEIIYSLFRNNKNISLLTNTISTTTSTCRFIKDRCTFIRWDGMVSPCMGLLHSYNTFIHGYERNVKEYTFGNISDTDLKSIWDSKEYMDFREKVERFNFSPCHRCGGCDLIKNNNEDCYGNSFPVCGACLWAHGVIQCP